MPRHLHVARYLAPLAAVALLVSCGSDDEGSTSSDAPTTTAAPITSDTPSTTDAPSTTGTPSTTVGASGGETPATDAAPAQPSDSAHGTLTMHIDGDTISAEITACANNSETQVSITASGETSQIQVEPATDNRVAVTVSGAVEFEGVGDAVVSDAGGVSITGTGAPADPSAPTADFSIEAQITSC